MQLFGLCLRRFALEPPELALYSPGQQVYRFQACCVANAYSRAFASAQAAPAHGSPCSTVPEIMHCLRGRGMACVVGLRHWVMTLGIKRHV